MKAQSKQNALRETTASPLEQLVVLSFILIFLYLSLFLTKYEYAIYLSLLPFFLVYFRILKKRDFNSFILILILFLILFDNKIFTYTSFNVRVWYFLVGLCLLYMTVKKLDNNLKFNPAVFFVTTFFLLYSIVFFFLEGTEEKLIIIRNWMFNIGLIFVIFHLYKNSAITSRQFIVIFNLIIVFVAAWGLLQFLSNINSFNSEKFQHDWFNISPSAFFSERTWYGQYSAFGVITSIYLYHKAKSVLYLFFAFICLVGALLSFSRSAWIPIFAAIFCFQYFLLLGMKVNIKNFIKLLFLISIFIFFAEYWKIGGIQLSEIFTKFSRTHEGIEGRLEAVDIFIHMFKSSGVGMYFGQGFYWDPTHASSIYTAVGAKSASLYFFILHVFGYIGSLVFLTGLVIAIYKFHKIFSSTRSSDSKLFFVYLVSFLALALFVPVHFYHPGLIFLAISFFGLISKGDLVRFP